MFIQIKKNIIINYYLLIYFFKKYLYIIFDN